jgi:DHA1 family bicyclomycin/chloramphenicol resistance-like MFS transporter
MLDPGRPGRRQALFVSALLVACTVLGLAGTDLVLPAVPELPENLVGDAARGGPMSADGQGTGAGRSLSDQS